MNRAFWSGLDAYSRKARLSPALLVILPIVLGLFAWTPVDRLGMGVLVAILSACGATLLLAEAGRDLGKRKEPDLIRDWNGLPTIRLLRHRDDESNAVTRQRHHSALARLVPDVTMPTALDEASHPVAADRVYESCVHYLREATRDRDKFPLVFAENVSYGFRRNLWGMKGAGITTSLCATGGSIAAIVANWPNETGRLAISCIASGINAYLLSFWLLRVKPEWVHLAAVAYAERLLASCDVLHMFATQRSDA